MQSKKPSESRTELTDHILPHQTNPHGTLFGGEVLAYIDRVATICAARHARAEVVTASINEFNFLSPIKMGAAIIVKAIITYTGHTSLEVRVRVESEDLKSGKRSLTGICYLTFVALDENEKPKAIPQLLPVTDEEKQLFAEGQKRAEERAEKRKVK